MKVEADWLLFFYYSPGQNMFYLVNFYFVLHLNLFESVKIDPIRGTCPDRTCLDEPVPIESVPEELISGLQGLVMTLNLRQLTIVFEIDAK